MMADLYRRSEARAAPLRIGVLLDGRMLNASFAAVLEDIRASNFAKIEQVVFQKSPAASPITRSRAQKIGRRLFRPELRRRILYDLYARADQRFAPPDDPFKLVDCSELLQGIDSLEVEPQTKGFIHRVPPEDVARIQDKNLDVLLRFGFNILRGDVLTAARYGIWSFHHGDNEFYRGGPACFWELVEGNPLSGVILQVLTEELDAGLVLCKGLFPTEPTLLVSRNRRSPGWGSAYFVIWKLHQLHSLGWDTVRSQALPSPRYRGKQKIYRIPDNFQMIRWLGPKLAHKAWKRLWRRSAIPHWRIAVRAKGCTMVESGEPSMQGFQWLPEPRGRFWADPCLIQHGGRTWLFFEDYLYAENRGRISVMEIFPDGSPGPSAVALDNGKHLSYPFVFEYEGSVYMVPESFDTKAIPLYRATRFPNEWSFERNLLEGHPFVDTTLLFQDQRWWMFTTMRDPSGSCAALLLFHSTSLNGPWTPHSRNPISTDVRNARGAGPFVRRNGKLFRLSQDCSRTYGYQFTLNQVSELSPADYREQPWRNVDPSWCSGLIATHSYTVAGGIEAVDGCFLSPRHRHYLKT